MRDEEGRLDFCSARGRICSTPLSHIFVIPREPVRRRSGQAPRRGSYSPDARTLGASSSLTVTSSLGSAGRPTLRGRDDKQEGAPLPLAPLPLAPLPRVHTSPSPRQRQGGYAAAAVANWPQAASMSWPRLRRTVTRTSSRTRARMKRSNSASGGEVKPVPSTGLYTIRLTLEGAQRVTAARWRASSSESFWPAKTQYS